MKICWVLIKLCDMGYYFKIFNTFETIYFTEALKHDTIGCISQSVIAYYQFKGVWISCIR